MERKHYKGIGLIKELFEEDKKEFFKLPEVPFEVYLHEFAKADNYGKVKFDTRIYSSSPSAAGTQVMIKAGAYDVEILDSDCNLIVRHKRLYGDERVYDLDSFVVVNKKCAKKAEKIEQVCNPFVQNNNGQKSENSFGSN
ncbi:MAG: Mu transposase domain-containing protein [Bacillota bacterium]